MSNGTYPYLGILFMDSTHFKFLAQTFLCGIEDFGSNCSKCERENQYLIAREIKGRYARIPFDRLKNPTILSTSLSFFRPFISTESAATEQGAETTLFG